MSREKEALFKIQHFSSSPPVILGHPRSPCRMAGLACHLPITVKLVNQHLVLIVSERFLRFGKVPHFAVPTLLHHPTDTDILGVVHPGLRGLSQNA